MEKLGDASRGLLGTVGRGEQEGVTKQLPSDGGGDITPANDPG